MFLQDQSSSTKTFVHGRMGHSVRRFEYIYKEYFDDQINNDLIRRILNVSLKII